jgi:2-polyprenyl-6-methoxyphenol hydroxylase-like FAD-dependent oxidoreductase
MSPKVLVVGAGPVGLAMAAELARYGVAVRIVEQAGQRTDKSKALVVWSRTLELLDRAGCADALIAAGMKVTGANIVAGAEQIAHLDFDHVASPHPYALMLPQSETERVLEEHLNSLGVRVERNVKLLEHMPGADEVTAKLRLADGSEETLETAWLAACDGAHSTVRHQLGIGFEGKTLPSDWVLADVHLQGVPTPDEVYLEWHEEGLIAIFPITRDRFRFIADVGAGNAHRPDPTLDEMQAILDKRGLGRIRASNPIWLAAFHINERKVKDYRVGRVFLVGDAAHVHSPAGGQGMNTGIQDACNLAWKLAQVCHGVARPEPLLTSYSIERSAVGEQVLKNAGRLTSVGIMRGGIKQALRNHLASLLFGISAVREAAAATITEVAIAYDDSPLNGRDHPAAGGPAAGRRAPIRAGEPPVGGGKSPCFVVFAEGGGEEVTLLLSRYTGMLEPRVRPPFQPGGMWLVRPDGYVAVATENGRWGDIETVLERIALRR